MLSNTSFSSQSLMFDKGFIKAITISNEVLQMEDIQTIIVNNEKESIRIKFINGKQIVIDAIVTVMRSIAEHSIVIFDMNKDIVSISLK